MDILFSLFNVNFEEFQMKCFYSLIGYLMHRRSFGCLHFKKKNKTKDRPFDFFGLIVKQSKSISVV